MNISATILAAGASKRMGKQNKLLMPINNMSVIRLVCKTVLATRIDSIIVVTGYEHQKVAKEIPSEISVILYNKDWKIGMMSSIYTGISKLDDSVDGNMIILGDMPLISEYTINSLITEFKIHSGKRIIYPLYDDKQANPVIFPKKYFSEIITSSGKKGCKRIIKKYQNDAIGIPTVSNEVILDCDTQDDYLQIIGKN
tara:strand:+ start:11906 stop:12499 length:594 start_codon:yes stop_codon:yes gene_type:complete